MFHQGMALGSGGADCLATGTRRFRSSDQFKTTLTWVAGVACSLFIIIRRLPSGLTTLLSLSIAKCGHMWL